MKWIVFFFAGLWLGFSAHSVAQNTLLQVSASHQQDAARAFTGIAGLKVKRLETKFSMPIAMIRTYLGNWFSAFEFSENRFELSGSDEGLRRMYRISMPIEYQPRTKGRLQYYWRFAPSYYADESLIEQVRYVHEFAWQVKYRINSKAKWVAGFRQDTLFGETTQYPVFGLESQANKRLFLHWVYPNMYSQLTLPNKDTARVFIRPSGGNWLYKQADGSIASLGITDWNIGAAWFKSLRSPLELKLEVGMQILGESEVAGAKGDLADGYFFLVSLQSRLPK